MINVAILLAILASVMVFRVWLARFIAGDHELDETWRRR